MADPNPFKAETATGKLKKYKSPGRAQILAELTQTGCKTLLSEINKLTQWMESIAVPVYKKDDK